MFGLFSYFSLLVFFTGTIALAEGIGLGWKYAVVGDSTGKVRPATRVWKHLSSVKLLPRCHTATLSRRVPVCLVSSHSEPRCSPNRARFLADFDPRHRCPCFGWRSEAPESRH